MTSTERNRLPANEDFLETTPAGRNAAKKYVSEFSAAEIKEALIPDLELTCPLEELIATGEAVFAFIRHSEMDPLMKNAFCQLEKQFDFYKNLVQR
ncbi:MAG: hypothetical protein Q8941_23890 [Bacteroidota bacterium]|nr:hypothetical protein [Bacteroidota bacterium]